MALRNRPNPLHRFVLPHRSNGFKPKIIGIASMTVVLFLVIFVEGTYLFDTNVVLKKTSFTASVLPSVLISLTNQDRQANGVGQLTENPLLDQAAQLKANDEAANGYFAHVSPSGTAPWHWLQQVGYSYSFAGENLAINFDDSTQVEQAWMNSPTHRANIVKPEYTQVGIATAQGMYQGQETTFVVQYFATPGAASAAPQPVQVSQAPPTAHVVADILPTKTRTASTTGAVLGTQISASTSSSTALAAVAPVSHVAPPSIPAQPTGLALFFAKIAASPTATITYALVSLMVLAAILFLIAVTAHLRVPHPEALGATFAVFAIALGMLVVNATDIPRVSLPSSNLSASVVNAL